MRWLLLLNFLLISAEVSAEELLINDSNGLNRLREEIQTPKTLVVRTKPKKVTSVELVNSTGFGQSLKSHSGKPGIYTFEQVPAGRYIIKIEPESATVKTVEVK